MSAFTRAAAALVADPNMGTAIIYRPVAAASFECRGVFSRPVQEFGQAVAGALMCSIPVDLFPEAAKGDAVVPSASVMVGASCYPAGTFFRVEKVEADETMAMFDLTLSAP